MKEVLLDLSQVDAIYDAIEAEEEKSLLWILLRPANLCMLAVMTVSGSICY